VIAIRIQGLGRYFRVPVVMDGAAQPREAWRSLLRIMGFDLKTSVVIDDKQRTVTMGGHVLRDLSLDIEQGSVVCLTGASGSGKSVLLKILGGVMAPTSGRVEIYGQTARLLTIGDAVNSDMTAHENIRNSPEYCTAMPGDAERFETKVIDFAELEGFEHVALRTYSTGMLMRLNVALTLCSTCPIMLIDDVLAVGDIAFQQKVVDKLRVLKDEGRTLVIASSDDALVHQIATRVLTLGNGQILSDAPPRPFADHSPPSAGPAEFEWQATQDLPEDDVMALRAMTLELCHHGDETYLQLGLSFDAKVPGVRCRPSVFLMQRKKIILRTLYPEYIDLSDPCRFTCVVRIPLHILSSGTYLITPDIHTFSGNSLYVLKARDAVTLTVRRDARSQRDRRTPLLTIQFPWEVESMVEAQA
jgi:ABC-type polysaccharide/polyol phosphate transport system ATPase subunit